MSAAVVFPGQGSQFVGMADPWMAHEAGRGVLSAASEAMGRDVVADCHDESALGTTDFVQPALLACDVAAFRVLDALGALFSGAAGHSLGEFAALVAADVLDLAPALAIVIVRGRAMQRAGQEHPGTMTALLGAGTELAAEICDKARGGGVLIVAHSVVVSGGASITAVGGAASTSGGGGGGGVVVVVSTVAQPSGLTLAANGGGGFLGGASGGFTVWLN